MKGSSGRLKALLLLAGLVALCAACAPSPAPPAAGTTDQVAVAATTPVPSTAPSTAPTWTVVPPLAPEVQSSPVYTMTTIPGYVDTYFVDPNLDDVRPALGERVTVRARLMKNGVRLGGMPVRVTWVQGGEEQSCDFFPVYLSGCTIEVRDFAPGEYVPVTVTMRYRGMVFVGYSGFTPQ